MSTATEPTPKRPRQFTLAERNEHFPLDYEVVLDRNGKPDVKVPAAWESKHLVRLGPYQNIQIKFSPRVHVGAASLFAELFEAAKVAAWNSIITYDGGFVARLKRGVTLPAIGSPKSAYDKLLSNHSRGTAIDLNAKWNRMGIPYSPMRMNGAGDLAHIINIANTIRVEQPNGQHWGIVCGAHWKGSSIDPMHFEVGVWP